MIAIPDFSAGAMENWGLITYRETALLCDAKTASVAAKARIAYVIAHELAHQWFGNLVTMEWWKELWLNEGFATFVGTQAIAHFYPEWQVWTQFLTDYVARALSVDSLRNSHPIEVNVEKARSITEIFDAISYCKGASVIRMIENFLGEEAFRKGLNIYLNRFKYGNAVTKDLWKGLGDGSGKDVSTMMDKWTSAIGYPVVTVEETDQVGKYKVTQSRFLASGDPKPEEDTTIWHIKLGISSKSQPQISYVDFNSRSSVIDVKVNSKDEWVKFNAGQSGFYRVAYPKEMSARLGDAIKNNDLPAADRHGIQSDAFALARAGSIPLAQALALAQNYVNETDFTVWTDLSANLGEISTLLDGSEASPLFDKYMLALYSKISSLGWDPVPGEKDLNKQLRGTILNKLATHGNSSVEVEAKARFNKFLADQTSLSSDLQGVVFKTAMRVGGDEEFDAMVKTYKGATQPEMRIRALQCIGFSKKAHLIQKALDYSLTEDVRTQDTMYLFASSASTAQGRELSWKFVKSNWDTYVKKLEGGMGLLGHIVKHASGSGSTQAWLDDVETFFKSHSAAGIERTVQQVIESLRGNVAYLNRNKESVTAWLKQNFH
jgi:puromycin-sensitive aminopeptidase